VRIVYDGLIFSTGHTGGIRRYFNNLITRLPDSVEPWITTNQPPGLHFPTHPNLKTRYWPRVRPRQLSAVLERIYFRGVEWRNRFDVAHPTYFDLLNRRYFSEYRCPVVVTVYDMISEFFSNGTARELAATDRKRNAVMAAQRIICISHNTKRDLIEVFKVPEANIRVVYLATELTLEMSTGFEPVPSRPYFLFVGSHAASYKNFDRLLFSFALLQRKHPGIVLCVAGPEFSPAQHVLIESLKLTEHVQRYDGVSDRHLARLYHQSVGLVYPSLYEGFGIPPLEAMACETAVIASSGSSIPEVVQDAGILIDTESEEQLVAAMTRLLEDAAFRTDLINRGRIQNQRFSWDLMASEIYQIYCEVSN